jgi:hypothetical protein
MISRCGDKFEMVAERVLVFDGDSFGEGDCKRELDQITFPKAWEFGKTSETHARKRSGGPGTTPQRTYRTVG